MSMPRLAPLADERWRRGPNDDDDDDIGVFRHFPTPRHRLFRKPERTPDSNNKH